MIEENITNSSWRVVSRGDSLVKECKETVVSEIRRFTTEIRIIIHTTEMSDISNLFYEMDKKQVDKNRSDDEVTYYGSFPEYSGVLDTILDRMDERGNLPVTAIEFVGDEFEVVVTSSTSHSHVGRVETDDEELLGQIADELAGIGVIVPDRPTLAWDGEGAYWELDAHELCEYAERPESDADRRTTTHTCHDLTRLVSLDADPEAGRFDLVWDDIDSLAGRAMQAVLGRPPTELRVQPEQFGAVETYLQQFVGSDER